MNKIIQMRNIKEVIILSKSSRKKWNTSGEFYYGEIYRRHKNTGTYLGIRRYSNILKSLQLGQLNNNTLQWWIE